MRNNKIREIVVCFFLCLAVSACGQKSDSGENTVLTEDAREADTQKAEADTDSGKESADNENADEQQTLDEGTREITAEEMQYFTEFVQKNGNFGFLLSVYDTPADVNLNEVCYNGFGASSLDGISQEEKEAYKKTTEWGEVYTDFFRITTAQLDDFLLETTGLSYEQMNHPLDWTYLPEYDAYYSDHGDTNYRIFICKGGYTADEKFFVLRMAPDDFGITDGYHKMDYELTLEKCGDTYQFHSNRLILEDGLIEDQSFDVDLSPIGEVTFI